MAIVRWDSFGELNHLQDRVNRLFSDAYGRNSTGTNSDDALMTTGTWSPPVDIYQNAEQELVVKAELPDVAVGVPVTVPVWRDPDRGTFVACPTHRFVLVRPGAQDHEPYDPAHHHALQKLLHEPVTPAEVIAA